MSGRARGAPRNPHADAEAKAEHGQSTITDRYIHGRRCCFPAGRDGGSQMFGVAG